MLKLFRLNQQSVETFITLNTGRTVPKDIYHLVMEKLQKLYMNNEMVTLNELFNKCKNSKYKMKEGTEKIVEGEGLIVGDGINPHVRHIILAAIKSPNENTIEIDKNPILATGGLRKKR